MIERNDYSKDGKPEESEASSSMFGTSTSEVSNMDDGNADSVHGCANPEPNHRVDNRGPGKARQSMDEIEDGGWLCL